LDEGEARLAIALHYSNPYPRPVYAPPKTHTGTTDKGKRYFEQRVRDDATPLYIRSQRDQKPQWYIRFKDPMKNVSRLLIRPSINLCETMPLDCHYRN
jgi:hypothetical protein